MSADRPRVLTTIDALRAAVAEARRPGRHGDGTPGAGFRGAGFRAEGARVVLVPTMGALHAGHRELARRAAELGDIVVVSIFVNPLQFGPNEDLDRYPRTLEADLDVLAGFAQLVFAPSVAEMYPDGAIDTRVAAGPVASLYEGASRPGHFDGVLTVVSKLVNIVMPDVAVFGRKDAQQAFLVGRMVRDLNLPLSIAVVDTVRESDGLALSSRNRYLDGQQRSAAVTLSAALRAGAARAADGADAALAAAMEIARGDPAVKLDYLVVVDPETFQVVAADHRGPAIMLVAAHLGTTRLIDNERFTIG